MKHVLQVALIKGWGLNEQNPPSCKGYYADFRRILKIDFKKMSPGLHDVPHCVMFDWCMCQVFYVVTPFPDLHHAVWAGVTCVIVINTLCAALLATTRIFQRQSLAPG